MAGGTSAEIVESLRSIASGARQGASWGAKIRLPHALVMTALFHKGTLRQKLRRIVDMALVHARNLALYAAVYKAALSILLMVSPNGRRAASARSPSTSGNSGANGQVQQHRDCCTSVAPWQPLVAGGLGGYLVWGRYSGVNYQVTLYVLSRVVISLLRLCAKRGLEPFRRVNFQRMYPYGTAAVWASVMYLWECHPELVQPSMRKSMDFIYRDGDRWRGVRENLLPSREYLLTIAGAIALACWDGQSSGARERGPLN